MSCLVTGGTGTFGRAFVGYWLKAAGPDDRICVYSRGEHVQAAMRQKLNDDPRIRWFIGDVRDRDRLRRAMAGVEAVVHAAALKRIEVGAYNPSEMVRTNVEGTINVIEASRDAGVTRVVGLSSDKAFQPCSPYGYSKALAESLMLSANDGHGPMFACTRYGNIAGSEGSVIPKWRAMIAVGKKAVPVTDPDCTRFWMEIDQAVGLVVRTLEAMKGGELNIPELPAYRLADLAEAMGVKMTLTGLPDFEKKHESMCEGNCSKDARRMTVAELREALANV